MNRIFVVLFALLAGCAVDVAEPALDNPLDDAGKADGEPWCSIESIRLSAPFTDLEIPSNVCHDRSSMRVEIGQTVTGQLAHPVVEGGASIGCTLITGEVDIAAPVAVEGRVFAVPVTEGTAVSLDLGGSSRAALDLLVARQLSESVSQFLFVEHGNAVDVVDDGGSSHVHVKDGERFVVVRVRPRRLCPGDDHVDFELTVAPTTPRE